jgi:hypothetical protein
MDEAQGIYRGEVLAIMGALADIQFDTLRIRALLDDAEEAEDDGEEDEP